MQFRFYNATKEFVAIVDWHCDLIRRLPPWCSTARHEQSDWLNSKQEIKKIHLQGFFIVNGVLLMVQTRCQKVSFK